jgi:ubiquinone/menaquinone biosynthesis C-methylase UbiE
MEKSRIVILLVLSTSLLVWGEDYHSITHRRIAGVMGYAGADWLTRPEREAEEHPDQALDAIGIEKGTTVADIGAGVGYYSWRLAQRVGPTGTVYGEDIQPEMITKFRQNMAERKLTNVKAVLGAYDDPKLPKDTLDLVILVDVYHEFSEPEKMLQHIRESMKPGGRLVLLEYRAEDPTVPIRPEHEMTVKMVRAEVEPEGFKFDKTIEVLPWQHIIVFRR